MCMPKVSFFCVCMCVWKYNTNRIIIIKLSTSGSPAIGQRGVYVPFCSQRVKHQVIIKLLPAITFKEILNFDYLQQNMNYYTDNLILIVIIC